MKTQNFMKRALQLAEKGRGYVNPNPLVGAVVVKNGKIIGEGWHQKYGEAHAEVHAIAQAGGEVEGADLYVTLEPCSHQGKTPPCADLVIRSKIARVFIGMTDPNPLVAGRGIAKLKAAGIEVITGVLEEECRKMNEVFLKYITEKRPFVLLKSAISLDGKIAAASGESQWISGEESRNEVQKLRHIYTGIMAGIGTVLADDPRLTCRMSGGRNPVRIIVNSRLRIPEDANLIQGVEEAPVIIAVTTQSDPEKRKRLTDRGIRIAVMPEKDGRVSLSHLMEYLGESGIDSILLEGGGILNDAMLKEGLVDKVCYYIAPKLIGGDAAPGSIRGSGIASLSEVYQLKDFTCRKSGDDLCVEGYL